MVSNVNNQQQQQPAQYQKNGVLNAALWTGAGAGLGYLGRKPSIKAEELIEKTSDEFVKSLKGSPNQETQQIIDSIKSTLDNKGKSTTDFSQEFTTVFGNKSELSVEEYIKKLTGAKNAKELEEKINALRKDFVDQQPKFAAIQKELQTKGKTEAEIAKLHVENKKIINKLNIDFENYKKHLNVQQISTQSTNGILKKDVVEKITKKAYKENMIIDLSKDILKLRKHLPTDAVKKSLIGAAIGLGLGVITNSFAKPKEKAKSQ